MDKAIEYKSAGDHALVAEFGNEISKKINEQVRALAYLLQQEGVKGVTETVPTYRSLMIHYNPLVIDQKSLITELKKREEKLKELKMPPPLITEIPTIYGGAYGPDLEDVAKHAGVSEEEVIQIHSSGEYLIYMLGFTPGFPYLGGMDPRIAAPRLNSPRKKITRGSVGIADAQTGIYSLDSPGGWRLIGWTPVALFDPKGTPPFLLKAGDYIKFCPIDHEEYEKIQRELKAGGVPWKTYRKDEEKGSM
ncbi:5-oxoprolinase subunit PxpB [Isachenkonia alkalipeptolytica]|uniref:5-oxoprolinase subunit PxpB n=1 Tax=Isachenkonia alkalipeptolytica TaxID=2565777 RepID=A0AA44BD14_9CLOT|nr:5-oxoprolinase subunit PxpB [Isachenkonia alkalipeptolytica]NBG87899.1 5-oxoprolinase subunit PxpB [Isachenkonia alkalipeptolytica]